MMVPLRRCTQPLTIRPSTQRGPAVALGGARPTRPGRTRQDGRPKCLPTGSQCCRWGEPLTATRHDPAKLRDLRSNEGERVQLREPEVGPFREVGDLWRKPCRGCRTALKFDPPAGGDHG